MGLSPGTRLGPYQIAAPIGAGGMGEVYRARDTRLGRDVAVKVLPPDYASDSERLKRFQQEARAAGALNHPNVLAVFDVGTHDGAPFLVTELLEGETLRVRIQGGPLPVRKSIEIAREISLGLAAAHAKGIVHRDLKPENVFLTRDGRVKILDFGVAKLTRRDEGSAGETVSHHSITESSFIVGTVGYMAPEQVRGEVVDHRADLFALGCVLREMLTGKRAFGGAGTVETLHAILHDEPAPLDEVRPEVTPALAAVVHHCLEKEPTLRFQSAHDVAFALGNVAGVSGTARAVTSTAAPSRARQRLVWAAVGLAVLALAATATVIAVRSGNRPQPSFERLTFRRGSLSSARFSPDGVTIVYSASWDGEPTRVYSTRLDSRESSPLQLPDARLLSVSTAGDLAITIGPGATFAAGAHTTLARVPLAGGAPREIAEEVSEADWSPGDRGLAVVHAYSNRMTLEYPTGKEIWRTTSGIINPRVSPRGDLIAFIEMDSRSDFNRGYVAVADLAGRVRHLTGLWETIQGIAWGPRGDEVWFTGVHRGSAKELWAVSLGGRERLILRTPGGITLCDVSREGQALVSQDNWRMSLVALLPGKTRERDLSWQDMTGVADLSPDGRRLIFTEYSEAYENGVIGMRSTDGSPVVHLGDGYAGGLSPDGKWVVALVYGTRPHLSLLPTGPGQALDLDPGPVKDFDWSCWAPDGRHVLFSGIENGHGVRAYVQDITGGPPRAFTPDGIGGFWRLVSPDGKFLMGGARDSTFLFPLDGSAPRFVPSLRSGDEPSRWLPDGRSVLVVSPRISLPVHVERLDLASGERHLVRDLAPSDAVGFREFTQIFFTPDTRTCAYSYRRILSDLYLVTGLQ